MPTIRPYRPEDAVGVDQCLAVGFQENEIRLVKPLVELGKESQS